MQKTLIYPSSFLVSEGDVFEYSDYIWGLLIKKSQVGISYILTVNGEYRVTSVHLLFKVKCVLV